MSSGRYKWPPLSGVFKHLFIDGRCRRTIFATPHALKIVPDLYPLRIENPRKGPIPSIENRNMEMLEADGEVTLCRIRLS